MFFIFDTLQSLLATLPSRLPLHTLNTLTHTYTQAYTLPPRWTVPHSHSVICSPLLFSSHPCFFFVSFPSLTFLSPSDDCGGGDSSNETQGDIWRFQPTYFSLPLLLSSFSGFCFLSSLSVAFFVFSSKFLFQHCCTFLEKGGKVLVEIYKFRILCFLCSCVVCVFVSLLRFI